jgi:hypothetical protein
MTAYHSFEISAAVLALSGMREHGSQKNLLR